MSYKVNAVYNAGGQPTETYVTRAKDDLEGILARYLQNPNRVLCVHGPTKTGKTVGIRSKLSPQDSIWIAAGEIDSIDEFWQRIVLQLEGFTSTQITLTDADTEGGKFNGEVGLTKGPVTAKIGGELNRSDTHSEAETRGLSVQPRIVGPTLLRESGKPVIIDDFHYLSSDLQRQIIRGLKGAIFDGVGVVLIAVPQHAFDAVQAEPEMTGRIESVEVGYWDNEDLRQIAERGYKPLNIWMPIEDVDALVTQSFNSPFLMQRLCEEYCRSNGIAETVIGEIALLKRPADWAEFFGSIARGFSKKAYDELARGPRQRTDRVRRRTKEGADHDIYEVVLLAVRRTGPKFKLPYEEIRNALREILQTKVPQAQEVTRVLGEMHKIAHSDKIPGEPVLEYVDDESCLYVTDPFFSFYLRWGVM